jgi:uncharacterized membrane protein YecN with MAPEG domain
MPLTVTPIYGALMGLWLIVLSMRVIDLRGSPVTAPFRPADRVVTPQQLQRAIRAHGNLTEYLPTFLVLLAIAELNGVSSTWLHVTGVTFAVGRVMHGICFGFLERSIPLRIGGTACTLTGLLAVIVLVLI